MDKFFKSEHVVFNVYGLVFYLFKKKISIKYLRFSFSFFNDYLFFLSTSIRYLSFAKESSFFFYCRSFCLWMCHCEIMFVKMLYRFVYKMNAIRSVCLSLTLHLLSWLKKIARINAIINFSCRIWILHIKLINNNK